MTTDSSWRASPPVLRLAALACMLCLTACVTNSPPDPCKLAYAGELPLWHVGNRLFVPVGINGTAMPLLLDTGGAVSLLSSEHAAALKLRGTGAASEKIAQSVSGVGGSRTVTVMKADSLRLGQLVAFDVPFFVPEPSDTPSSWSPDTLGMNVLRGFDVDLDLAGSRLALFQADSTCASPHVLLSQPLYSTTEVFGRRDGLPVVFVSVHDQRFRALLDTGSQQSLMFADAAARLGLSPAVLQSEPRLQLHGVGLREVDAVRRLSEPIGIGGLTISQMHLNISTEIHPDLDMILGMDFLSRVHLWLSNSSREVVLQYPPRTSPRVR